MSDRPYTLIEKINTVSATPTAEALVNLYLSSKRNHPKIPQLPEWGKSKGEWPLALIGGGPSAKTSIDELQDLGHGVTTMVIGSAHDWYRSQSGHPDYAVICDPDPKITALYLKNPSPLTTYLVATQCHESVFRALEGMPIVLWHCASEEQRGFLDALEPGWGAIGGGCTAGMRALGIAILLGYKNLHLFGYDSCIQSEDEHHAYGFETPEEELGDIYKIKVGTKGIDEASKEHQCAGYMLAQAKNFEDFWKAHRTRFVPTFHGEGLMKAAFEALNNAHEGIEL